MYALLELICTFGNVIHNAMKSRKRIHIIKHVRSARRKTTVTVVHYHISFLSSLKIYIIACISMFNDPFRHTAKTIMITLFTR